jgi:DUF1680 family protein
MRILLLTPLFAAVAITSSAAGIALLPEKIPCAAADRQDAQIPDRVHLSGMIGTRIERNASNRLLAIDPNRLLEGYRKRPGRQTWDGEHLGKWLHAATLAWANTGNPQLREKMDYVVREVIKCQLDDGYLGTYLPKDRWTEWDVWAHKYNLLGLIAYMRYTGDATPLCTCRKMADLLCRDFGDRPGQHDLNKAGEHMGMAPGSVLEPMVLLYRLTGDEKYRDFCLYILRAWEQPSGPHIVSRLLAGQGVNKLGDAKAYEMLSCINGLAEWYRTSGDRRCLRAVVNAWDDITTKRNFITGAVSSPDYFRDDYLLPNASGSENCDTITWLQLGVQLLRLTGEARYSEQLERVLYNQVLGGQRPDGKMWGGLVPMEGGKGYGDDSCSCCVSSGPRGVALVPTFAIATDADGVAVNLYDAGRANLRLRDGVAVKLGVKTTYPAVGKIAIAVDPVTPHDFSVKLRIPNWCAKPLLRVNGQPVDTKKTGDGYAAIRRTWRKGDTVEMVLNLEPRLVLGEHTNLNKAAVVYGPLVLAADAALAGGKPVHALKLASGNVADLAVTAEPAPEQMRSWPGAQVFCISAMTRKTAPAIRTRLVPFADAGATGSQYRVWLPLLGTESSTAADNLLEDGTESRSRAGNVDGSLIEGGFVVTFNGESAKEDWYAVALDQPVTVGRVVFLHGRTFHDGGWFDTSAGKPKVQIQATQGSEWKTVGELADYPATTASNPANLAEGAKFHCKLAEPVEAVAVRVVGKPACGDAPQQAFSSCGGLRALPQ